jgi:phosphoribosylaminoimidazolecarboxamide formyltransferase/IMP cyclohydrolase
MQDVVPVRRALLSVSDKTGLVELARALADRGVHLLASGGTRAALVAEGLTVTEISAHTGQPEILGGRVKTLHPRCTAASSPAATSPRTSPPGGAGDRPDRPGRGQPVPVRADDRRSREATFEDAIEDIDIGGPSLIRGAAKNHAHVAVVTSPDQYPALIGELQRHGGTTLGFRRILAVTVFRRTARYDALIADYLGKAAPISAPTTTSPGGSRRPSRPCSRAGPSSATGRTRTNRPRSTSSRAPPGPAWRPPGRSTARSSRITTCSTWTARCGWCASSPSRPRRS